MWPVLVDDRWSISIQTLISGLGCHYQSNYIYPQLFVCRTVFVLRMHVAYEHYMAIKYNRMSDMYCEKHFRHNKYFLEIIFIGRTEMDNKIQKKRWRIKKQICIIILYAFDYMYVARLSTFLFSQILILIY